MHRRIKAAAAGLVIVIFFVWLTFFQNNLFPFLFQVVFNRGVDLKEFDGRINILLLGIGGGVHEGADLTDTLIFASINPTKNSVTLVSIPRDLWVPELSKYCNDCGKINTAYAIGGLPLAEKTVSKILNQPIGYGARLNFNGFTQAVDLVGGLDVNIDRTFDDFEYPIDGKENDPCGHKPEDLAALASSSSQLKEFPCRYKHIHFDKGKTHLNGENALEYVRSRHALADEGTDFARSARQEKVIKAFKDKIFSLQTLINPVRLIGLYNILKSNIDTDIKKDELDDFVRLFQSLKNTKVESAVIDYGDTEKKRPGLLINPPISSIYNFEWVLIPRIGNGNFQEIQGYVDCEITLGGCSTSALP